MGILGGVFSGDSSLPAGGSGSTGFSAPVSGVSTIDPATKRINGFHSAQSIGAGVTATGSSIVILTHQLASESSKLVLQLWCKRAPGGDGKIQTIDAAKRAKVNAGVWSLVTSGTDVADDTDGLGGTFAITVNSATGLMQISGTATAGLLLGATVNEVW